MKPELDDLLCHRHPEIFAERHGDPRYTCMTRGFECGDGWYDLIDDLCTKIEAVASAGSHPVCGQVKEKFGKLRFYVSGNSDVQALCQAAEADSANICEECGATPASMSALGGFYRTRCPECYIALRKELGPHVFNLISKDDIGPALLYHRQRVIEEFIDNFGINEVRAKWAELEPSQSQEMVRQVRSVLGTIEAKIKVKKAADK